MPLVLAFHGDGGTPREMERLTRLDRVADRDHFIVVYPAGLDRSWAAGVNSGADRADVDDVAFTTALLETLEAKYRVDRHRIVLTGFSNGAHLVELLGCRLAGHIAAIVPVSGTLADSLVAGCRPAHPLTVIEFHGRKDPIDPYGGGAIRIRGGGRVLGVRANIEHWAHWDRCNPRAVERARSRFTERVYDGCASDAKVRLFTLEGGGHTWPGGPQYLPKLFVGDATHVIDASEIVGAVATGKNTF